MSEKHIPEETRRAIFREVVEGEDYGLEQREARRKAATKFKVSVDEVARIETEGIEKTWPPLEECDEDE